jgi:hypothetical protein
MSLSRGFTAPVLQADFIVGLAGMRCHSAEPRRAHEANSCGLRSSGDFHTLGNLAVAEQSPAKAE